MNLSPKRRQDFTGPRRHEILAMLTALVNGQNPVPLIVARDVRRRAQQEARSAWKNFGGGSPASSSSSSSSFTRSSSSSFTRSSSSPFTRSSSSSSSSFPPHPFPSISRPLNALQWDVPHTLRYAR